jgi:lipid II:glycine glycyltransferase (peptidoglycan interpeptide bridge formation enzyme)
LPIKYELGYMTQSEQQMLSPISTPLDKDVPYICWNDVAKSEWENLLSSVHRSNLLQTYPYAQTMRKNQHMATRFGRLIQGAETIALFQIHEVKFTSLYHVITLDRGPLWLKSDVSKSDWFAFIQAFTKEFPKRLGRRRRFMPELSASPWAETMLKEAGLERKADGYQSIWLDLSQSQAELRAKLKQKWRNALNQSERKHMEVHVRSDRATFNWLMTKYAEDRRDKQYRGPSVPLLRSLFEFCRQRDEAMMFVATKENETVAAILLFRHGASATYQVGWTSEEGRNLRAHQFLLWHGLLKLKSLGCQSLDLGGIHPEEAAGVTQFKRGLGGEEFQLIGIYV